MDSLLKVGKANSRKASDGIFRGKKLVPQGRETVMASAGESFWQTISRLRVIRQDLAHIGGSRGIKKKPPKKDLKKNLELELEQYRLALRSWKQPYGVRKRGVETLETENWGSGPRIIASTLLR